MKSLYDAVCVSEVKARLTQLQPESPRQWGKMNAPQAVAHCSVAMEWALGETHPQRMFVGRIVGHFIRPLVLRDDAPMRRNSPTAPALIVADRRDLSKEREQLRSQIDRFAAGGPGACTSAAHPFFGRLTPDEWAVLMYKHVDHHLRQFGV
jgi:Protein of unknown function (DUF1569)